MQKHRKQTTNKCIYIYICGTNRLPTLFTYPASPGSIQKKKTYPNICKTFTYMECIMMQSYSFGTRYQYMIRIALHDMDVCMASPVLSDARAANTI